MSFFPFLSILIGIIYIAIIFGVLYLVYSWVNRVISLKQEHNELLKEIIRKMDIR